MELAHTLTWERFTMETFYDAHRDRVRENTGMERNKKMNRFEGAAQISERVIDDCELGNLTL